MRSFRLAACALALGLPALAAGSAAAEVRVTLKSASSTSSYYVMMVQLAEMLRTESDGEVLPTVEESQGSVQNVTDAGRHEGAYLFTTPPSLLDTARAGERPFEGMTGFERVRTLFVMPFVTVHFVVDAEAGITDLTELAGHPYIPGGTGTFCERRTNRIFEVLGVTDVDAVDIELNNAASAIRNDRVIGLTTCSSHPSPQLVELATTVDVEILSLTDEQREQLIAADPLSGPMTIAAGTYNGQDEDVQTVGVPVGAYATTDMDDDTAYFIVKSFWEQRDQLAEENPWWVAVTPELIGLMGTKLHPGALRYYEEIGVDIPEDMR